MNNLPFCVVKSERFRRFLCSVNPEAWISAENIIMNLVLREYQHAITQVKQMLQTARKLIHLTFDGWTSRQNDSYLGITAHFLDQQWQH
jgi:hypothetical protein